MGWIPFSPNASSSYEWAHLSSIVLYVRWRLFCFFLPCLVSRDFAQHRLHGPVVRAAQLLSCPYVVCPVHSLYSIEHLSLHTVVHTCAIEHDAWCDARAPPSHGLDGRLAPYLRPIFIYTIIIHVPFSPWSKQQQNMYRSISFMFVL
jgi:hypothetical protein